MTKQKYEYKVKVIKASSGSDGSYIGEVCNDVAKKGWELDQVVTFGADIHNTFLIFRKPVK